eukprot:TRINITY_DN13277_c0_g1_i2.p1 TRINITY_DN13277_c0_g1~~TRINITY_DN13277_c0_g1_i2.p1  ORF type:complete len:481 (+),score=78.50 TRINITY_DN13277_c0_g1_i2:52-1494(+)
MGEPIAKILRCNFAQGLKREATKQRQQPAIPEESLEAFVELGLKEADVTVIPKDSKVETQGNLFTPQNMRMLALSAHGVMLPAMERFVWKHKETLRLFHLSATEPTFSLLQTVFGDDKKCSTRCLEGALGGDAQLAAQLTFHQLGGVVFFVDPVSFTPHSDDVDQLIRLSHVYNVMLALNPTSADVGMQMLAHAVESRNVSTLLPFFFTLESQCVKLYKEEQEAIAAKIFQKGKLKHPLGKRCCAVLQSLMRCVASAEHAVVDEAKDDVRWLLSAVSFSGGESDESHHAELLEVVGNSHGLAKSMTKPFDTDIDENMSAFHPKKMRCLALISHNHMKTVMVEFVRTHRQVLRRFRLTGTATTMKVLKSIFGEDRDIVYGPTCSSGPLGGDAEVTSQICMGDIGGVIFLVDPLSAHPHHSDIAALLRLSILSNILLATNTISATTMVRRLQIATDQRNAEEIPSFFNTLTSLDTASTSISV